MRQVEQVIWKTGRGNSYVLVACDVNADSSIDRSIRTEYTINNDLMECIAAANAQGLNARFQFVSEEAAAAAAAGGAAPAVAAPPAPEHPAPEN